MKVERHAAQIVDAHLIHATKGIEAIETEAQRVFRLSWSRPVPVNLSPHNPQERATYDRASDFEQQTADEQPTGEPPDLEGPHMYGVQYVCMRAGDVQTPFHSGTINIRGDVAVKKTDKV